MVFESLVVSLINRFLGDFVENLDTSQLDISLWNGDVILNNLIVRENLMDDFDVPFKVLFSNIGQLKLKIPWKNLYTESTIVLLDGVYIIVVANSSIVYDAAKEEKTAWNAKQNKLAKFEESKKREDEKSQEKEPKQEGFTEKLVSNIIKNLELKITNIHVRYEDSYTDPLKPFSFGITLRELSCQTTDERWKVTVIKEDTSLNYKLVKLDSLSLYWNVSPVKYSDKDRVSIKASLQQNIVNEAKKTDYQYMIEPLTSNACVRMNMKPEKDNFSLAKILVNVLFQEIAITICRTQYQILIKFLESFERMKLAKQFRKYRPNIPYKGYAKNWWHFAYQCILEETVRRRHKMWSWENIKRHRELCRNYRSLYKKKLLEKKPTADLLTDIEKYERQLDVFNIMMMRQQADVEARKVIEEEKKKPSSIWSIFGGSSSSSKSPDADSKSTRDKIKELMTPEEKKKLYDAIGFKDNVVTVFPIEYVGTELVVKLKKFGLKLIGTETAQKEVLNLQLKDVSTDVAERPGAKALKVKASMQSMNVTGLEVDGRPILPKVMSSIVGDRGTFFDVTFETNPLDGACDTRIIVNARPLEVAYDGETVISLTDFFKPPEHVHAVQMQAAALAKFQEMKQQTVSGLKNALQERKFTDISVCLQPTHFIVPENGVYKLNESRLLILDLGTLRIKTEKPTMRLLTNSLAAGNIESAPKLSFDEMKNQAYDRFQLSLQSFEFMFANIGDDWMKVRGAVTDMHIIQPVSINLDIYKSIISDVRLPKIQVMGNLPDLNITLTDQRLTDIMSLVQSLPRPKGKSPSSDLMDEPENLVAEVKPRGGDSTETDSSQKYDDQKTMVDYNETDVGVKFEIREIVVTLSQRQNDVSVPTVKVVIQSLGTELKMHVYDMDVTAYLGGIYLQHMLFRALDNGPLNVINTPSLDSQASKLLTVHILMAQQEHPTFATTYENTLQKIDVDFKGLELMLHQECILNLKEFGQSIQKQMPKPKESDPALVPDSSKTNHSPESSMSEKSRIRKSQTEMNALEVIDMALNARLDVISIGICTNERLVADIKIKGLVSKVALQKSKTDISASLEDIIVSDQMPTTLYHEILSFEGGKVFCANITNFNDATQGNNCFDENCVDTKFTLDTGRMKIIFLNKFVQDLMNVMNHFQEAKDKIREAGSVVKDRAATAAQEFSQKQPRISLNIKLFAPIVIIPKSSESTDAIIIDLGKLNVSNTFQILTKKDDKGLPAVLDSIVIELTSLRIFRALVLGTEVRAECLILEPVTLKLQIIRSLSASWYHDDPDFEILAVLQSFSIMVSQGDLGTTFGILTDNLKEGDKIAVIAPVMEPLPAKAAVSSPPPADTTLVVLGSGDKSEPTAPSVALVYSKLKASLTIEMIKLELFSGDTELSGGRSHRDEDHSLAKLELAQIQIKANLKSDELMEADVALEAIQLFDSRPSKGKGITHTIAPTRTGEGTEGAEKMIAILFRQDFKLNKDIDIEVNSLHIVVNLEFLLKVSDFFVKGLPKIDPVSSSQVQSHVESSPAPPVAEASNAELKFTFKLNNPEIVLVENALNVDTNALFLGLDVNLILQNSPDMQTMKGSLSGLNIESSTFSSAPDADKTMILSPVDIELNSKAPHGKNHQVEVIMTEIFLTVSSKSIRIITSALASLSVPKEEGEDDELLKIPKELWTVKKIEDCGFWFLKLDDGVSGAVALEKDFAACKLESKEKCDEKLLLTQSRVTVTLLCGVDLRTIPLITVQLGLKNLDVRNWSSKLHASCELTLEMTYNNEKLAVWEPLIEPVETADGHRPWALAVEVISNKLPLPEDETDGGREGGLLDIPKMRVNIASMDVMQMMISKTSLDVFKSLGQSFSDAYHLVPIPASEHEILPPYLIKNYSGVTIHIKVGDRFVGKPGAQIEIESDRSLVLESGQSVELFNSEDEPKNPQTGMDGLFGSSFDDSFRRILLTVKDCAETRELRLTRAEQRAFAIQQQGSSLEPWYLVSQIETYFGYKTITLRTNVQVHNCLHLSLEMHYKLSENTSTPCGHVEPGAIYCLPCEAFRLPKEVYFRPSQESYLEADIGCQWQNIITNDSDFQMFECKSTTQGMSSIYIAAKVEVEKIFFESKTEATVKSYKITLNPAVLFVNLLPVPVICSVEGSEPQFEVVAGEKMQMTNVKPGITSISVTFIYQSKLWTTVHLVEAKPETLSIWNFKSEENNEQTSMNMGLHADSSGGFMQLSLYSPYWMINKTQRNLAYKDSEGCIVKHNAMFNEAVFFSFKRSASGSSKKVSLQLEESDWSDKFSLDTVGSIGMVTCKGKSDTQHVGVKIALASTGLTKIITFLPFYTIINQANFTICYKEHAENAPWLEVEPGKCIPFWPSSGGDASKQLIASIKGTDLETKPFVITDSDIIMLQLNHPYGGINVEVQAVEGAITIIFQHYITGYATVLLVNDTPNHTLNYYQKDLKDQIQTLGPRHSVLYTWQDPVLKRELVWSCNEKNENKDELVKDGYGEFSDDQNSKLYWVSFLDGMQRVLLFTSDIAMVVRGQEAGELERVDMELNLCLEGIGLSLVNNLQCREIGYLGIASSGIIWEQMKGKRYKALKTKISHMLEDGFSNYIKEVLANKAKPGKRALKGNVEVDFSVKPMNMFKPDEGPIRRSFENGVWLQLRTSAHQTQVHLKIQRLQLDNQSTSAVFATVLAPTPPPKSVAAESVPKPFAELSIMIRKSSHSNVKQFKYCKLLVQEMAVSVDMGFISSMTVLFAPLEDDDMERLIAFKQDCELIYKDLKEHAIQLSTSDLKHFYDMMHFSPLKIHLSFSLYGTAEGQIGEKKPRFHFSILGLFLDSIGVVLADVHDVIFKLGYFERRYAFCSQSQLTAEITRHYIQQALKQLYVLVLGLDVLGNPFGIIRGLASGLGDLFYEPFQGVVQGPQEFVEGLALGVQSLLGNVLGGVTGAVSRITGTLGKTLAALTLDDEYQKRRREALYRPPSGITEGLVRGGTSLVMGLFDGLTGIVTRPFEGARQEGFGGLLKGLGKGVLGVVARPVGGIVDLASSSFDGIQRVADMSDEIYPLRPARFIQSDGVIRPYVFREAEGNYALRNAGGGIYTGDLYLGHVYVSSAELSIFLGTDKRVISLSKGEILGKWNIQWTYAWNLLLEPPSITVESIRVLLKEKKKGWFGSSVIGKTISFLEKDKKYAEAFIERLRAAMTASIPLIG